jgi:hypothetical protein
VLRDKLVKKIKDLIKYVKKIRVLIKYVKHFLIRELENPTSPLDVLLFKALTTALISSLVGLKNTEIERVFD